MPKIIIRKANLSDAYGKGYVHYYSWLETYTGLINQDYLDSLTLDRCVNIAKNHPENTFVAEIDNQIVGFACYMESRDKDLVDTGEITAIYVLKKHQGLGIGKKLVEACFKALKHYRFISLWVLKSNKIAIDFYEYLGFVNDNVEKDVLVNDNTTLSEKRMIFKNK